MCTARYYKSQHCGHAWLTLKTPCAPGRTFSNCPRYQDGALNFVASLPPWQARYWAPPNMCPWCDKTGNYNMDKTRVIKSERNGWRFGLGPGRNQPGVDLPGVCCVM